jgi:hypothetical protein
MDTRESSASPRPETTQTTDLTRIRGDRGRFLRGLDLARRKPSEYPWSERPTRVGEGKYRVPSRTTDQRYPVDLADCSCECSDAWYGATCQHVICALILESRRRSRMARLVSCDGCPARIPFGDTAEVTEDHVEWGSSFFLGDILCPDCARRGGLR